MIQCDQVGGALYLNFSVKLIESEEANNLPRDKEVKIIDFILIRERNLQRCCNLMLMAINITLCDGD
jgi:hypothetical protein